MSQHDMEITTLDANTGSSVRAAINAALQALVSLSSGNTEPTTTYAYQLWADTTTGYLKIRNAANTAWVSVLVLATGTPAGISGGAAGKSIRFTSSSAMDAVDIQGVMNLKPAKDGTSANKLNLYAKSSGAAPDVNNIITVPIPDGNGFTNRNRSATYLSGTGSFTIADAGNYWGVTSLADSLYPIFIYAIWDGTGIVWALSACPSLDKVTTTTTGTDKNYMLLEDSSTYSRSASHFCQLVGWVEAEYHTADTPDWTLDATMGVGLVAPEYLTKIGTLRWDDSGKAKPGELLVDGSSLPTASYRRLLTYYGGAIYGAADGSHFYISNPQGRFPRIRANGSANDPDRASRTNRGDGTTGDYVGTLQADAYKSHNHTISPSGTGYNPSLSGAYGMTINATNDGTTTIWSSGGNETRPINFNFCLFIRAY